MADAIEAFNRSGDQPPLRTRIGLHSGQMLLGQVGAGQHYEYRAVGDIVNTASRLQALNKQLGTRVLVSEAAIEGLHDVVARPLGAFILAGKTASVRICELLGIGAAGAPQRAEWTLFAEALGRYRAGDLPDAARRFEQVLNLAPNDGPARFYLGRCRREGAWAPDQPWSDVVVMDEK
jgi:adenylate cyclase